MITLASAVALSMLGACGAPPAEEGGKGVTIPNAFGETVIEKTPKRVVSIGLHEHDTLLALGVKPVALHQWYSEYKSGVGEWAEPLLGDSKPTIIPAEQTELNVEQIAELRPDLIVGTYYSVPKADYDRLSEIAPTLVRPKEHEDYAVPYEVETRMIGKAVGKEKEAEDLIDETEGAFAAARKEHPEFKGKKAAVGCLLTGGGIGLYASEDPRGVFLDKLGFTVPKEIDEAAEGAYYAEFGGEEIEVVNDYDLLLLIDDCGDKTSSPKDHPVFSRLDIAKEDRYIYPAPKSDALSHNTVLSIPFSIEALVPPVAKKLAG